MTSACCVLDKIMCNLYGNVVLLLEFRVQLLVAGPNTIRLFLLFETFVVFTDTGGYKMGEITVCLVAVLVLA